MKNNSPLVSILLPVYNGQPYLSEAIESVLSQKYVNLEVIAVDDCSKDQSVKVLKKFKAKDKRVKIYKNINHYGLTTSLNRALNKAKGEFIAFMPQDGRSSLERIGKQVSFLSSNPQIAAVGTQSTFIDEKGKIAGKSEYPTSPDRVEENLISTNSLLFESFTINKKLLPKDLLKFDGENYPFLYSTFFMKICKYSKIANLDKNLMFARINSQLSKNVTFDLERFLQGLKFWINAVLEHNYKPSLRSLFSF